ncbi:hypothetical protein PybrP1_008916 [[Pythium] brassicae (nom. inval.)]|nr:hypothetical protein PybrP1_008916 [[Pythium] brassicae (nom. inval.)]
MATSDSAMSSALLLAVSRQATLRSPAPTQRGLSGTNTMKLVLSARLSSDTNHPDRAAHAHQQSRLLEHGEATLRLDHDRQCQDTSVLRKPAVKNNHSALTSASSDSCTVGITAVGVPRFLKARVPHRVVQVRVNLSDFATPGDAVAAAGSATSIASALEVHPLPPQPNHTHGAEQRETTRSASAETQRKAPAARCLWTEPSDLPRPPARPVRKVTVSL